MYSNFTYYTPTKVLFGKDTVLEVGNLLKENHAKKVLLHYGSDRVLHNGLMNEIKSALNQANISYVTLGGVVPNPHLSKVYEGIELCREEDVDFILAVGGGSVLDSAKAIALGVKDDGDVWDFYEHTRKPTTHLPVGTVITIAATGSEMSDSSVITKEEGLVKRGCNTNLNRPVFAIMDPTLTATLPEYQTMAGCTDIMMHTMERYFDANGSMEITDSIAEALLKTMIRVTPKLLEDPADYEARAEVFWAGSLSHNGLTGCGNTGGDWACHRLEHELSGMFDVTHGAGLSALWATWARYVYKDALGRFVKFAKNVWNITEGNDEEIALAGIAKTEEFFRSIHMPTSFKELGIEVNEETCKKLAEDCEAAVGGKVGKAKVLYKKDMYEIYLACARM